MEGQPGPVLSEADRADARVNSFLGDIVKILKKEGRDVFVSKTRATSAADSTITVPTIRERQKGLKGGLRNAAFSLLDPWYGAETDIRKLGGVLFQWSADSWLDIVDPQIREAIEETAPDYPDLAKWIPSAKNPNLSNSRMLQRGYHVAKSGEIIPK